MATRKTKAQKEIEEAKVREQEWDVFKASYSKELTFLVYSFMNESIQDIVVVWVDSGWGKAYHFKGSWEDIYLPEELNDSYDSDVFSNFHSLKFILIDHIAQKKEAERIEIVKREALRKLTDEEKKLLGLV